MRYAQPRKLKTRRSERKAALNAWCLNCRQPMARHGRNFTCSGCHLATRIQLTGGTLRSRAIRQGTIATQDQRDGYPCCRHCRIRMQRVSRNSAGNVHAFRCRQCRTITSSRTERSKALNRESQILALVKDGYSDSQIVRKLKCHHRTVRKFRSAVSDPKRCECGELFRHVTKCKLRPGWQTLARERRNAFDDFVLRISRRVPGSLPAEMRDDICQEMLLEIMRSIDKVLANAPQYISDYKKRYPFEFYSYDANPILLERIAG